MDIDYLNGLSLGEAFKKYVLACDEVVDVGRRLMQEQAGYSAVFVEGQAPGPYVDFHWPLKITPEILRISSFVCP